MFDTQPTLQNEYVILQPLQLTDFEQLYAVAADPLVWEQHPNKNRYQRPVFQTFFDGAIASNGAFLVLDAATKEAIGCTRFYDIDAEKSEATIGYTFYARHCWGKPYNRSAKKLMLDHAFQYVKTVLFFIGANNIRSQRAIAKIGAVKIGEQDLAYYGEATSQNFIFAIEKG
jgi:RimJ/RimL family protein N-acetyltransferase